jgi:hypothetical protein
MGSFDYKPSYRRNLPHISTSRPTFFLTFRLAGSLPQSLVEQWKQEREWLEHLRQSNPFHYTMSGMLRSGIASWLVLNNPVKAGYVADWRDWKWNYRRE